MSRVTFATYTERRAKLNHAWRHNRGDFVDLSPKEQWILHEYYRFAESLNPDQLRQHWAEQRAKSSTMAQRAGRAYAAFEAALANKSLVEHSVQPVQARKRRLGKVRVDSIARPQPDTRKVARTLLEIVRESMKDSQSS